MGCMCEYKSLTDDQVLTWGNVIVNYYMDESSSHTRPKLYSIPVSCRIV